MAGVDHDQRDGMDGVSNRVTGATPTVGVQPVWSVAPVAPQPARPSAPAAPSAAGPACVPDFLHNLSSSFVLDWRDPTTDQVIDQMPMRTALAQFAEAATAALVGNLVDTTA